MQTLYLGGGTPSLLTASQINAICKDITFCPDAEVTLEINPLQITQSYLQELQTTPVNRLSLGVQSMQDTELEWLNRRHRAAQIPAKLALCRNFGYTNLSVDFIYGLPESSLDSVKQNLEAFLELQPKHISCYLLSLEEDCALYSQADRLPEDELLEEQYELIRQTLLGAGYVHYEISNFAISGYESKHNLSYWQSGDYLALGASASAKLGNLRYTNPDTLPEYYRAVTSCLRFPNQVISDGKRAREDFLMMGLRLLKGVDAEDYKNCFGSELWTDYNSKIAKLEKQGFLQRKGDRLVLTNNALFVSNSVIGELIL